MKIKIFTGAIFFLSHVFYIYNQQILHLPIDRKSFWISSYFGRRTTPDGIGFHRGIDFAALTGTPVKAAHAGRVVYAGYCGKYGYMIEIERDKTLKTRYAHLHVIEVDVGQNVKAEDCIGKVGATGNVRSMHKQGMPGKRDPSHLHFEVLHHGKPVNPLIFLKKI